MTASRIDLVVVYCTDLDATRDFYTSLGLVFDPEQHGGGPAHFAATLSDGTVLELYPAGDHGATQRLRLGFTVDRTEIAADVSPGRHILRDPDGRTVELLVRSVGPPRDDRSEADRGGGVVAVEQAASADVAVQ